LPEYSVIDLDLRAFEQELGDEKLQYLANSMAVSASHEARKLLRLQRQGIEAIFVFRLPVMLDWSVFPKSLMALKTALRQEAQKFESNAQLLIWTSNFEQQYEFLNKPGTFLDTFDLDDLRQSEFLSLARTGDVLFEHAGAAQFFLPSNQYSDYFLRVGNLQTRKQYFMAMFFWTLPLLRDVVHIFCDTWSISTTAAVLADYLSQYQVEDAVQRTRISWSFAPTYLPKSLTSQTLASDAAFLARSRDGLALFLSSFYSSGALETALIDELLQTDTRDAAKFVAIYGLRDDYEYCDLLLCNIGQFVSDLGLGGKGGQFDPTLQQLVVGRSSYIPDYRETEQIKFLRRDIERDKEFFECLVGKGIFSVHRDGKNSYLNDVVGGRHHAFHIDAAKLFSTDYFLQQIKARFAHNGSYSNVISDGSEAAEVLYKALVKALPDQFRGSKEFVLRDWRRMAEYTDLLDAVNSSDKSSLYLVPVVISGGSLGDLKTFLRKTSLMSMENIHFVIGLLRPSEEEMMHNYREIPEKYVYPSSASVITDVFLPNWGIRQCPWCREQDQLDLDELETNPLVGARRELLRSSSLGQGLSGPNVFFTFDSGDQLPFNGGSLFADAISDDFAEQISAAEGLEKSAILMRGVDETELSEADLCIVVANAIQNWRIRTQRRGVKRPVIDTATVASEDKYSEARLRAAIWRALLPSERSLAVRNSTHFDALVRRVFSFEDDEHYRCVELETLLAFPVEIHALFNSGDHEWDWPEHRLICYPRPND